MERVKVRNPEMTIEDISNRLDRQISDEERLKHATFSYSSLNEFSQNQELIEVELARILEKL